MSAKDRLKADLVTAMREREALRVMTIRALISAIDNAGAVEVDQGPYDPKLGLGHDVDRRHVPDEDVQRILMAEMDDLVAARDEYLELGQAERADEFDRRAEIALSYLD